VGLGRLGAPRDTFSDNPRRAAPCRLRQRRPPTLAKPRFSSIQIGLVPFWVIWATGRLASQERSRRNAEDVHVAESHCAPQGAAYPRTDRQSPRPPPRSLAADAPHAAKQLLLSDGRSGERPAHGIDARRANCRPIGRHDACAMALGRRRRLIGALQTIPANCSGPGRAEIASTREAPDREVKRVAVLSDLRHVASRRVAPLAADVDRRRTGTCRSRWAR
jgi:hypothetical protein